MLQDLKRRLLKKFAKNPQLKPVHFDGLIKIGSEYGSWTIPDGFLSEHSICYLAGAGEDISFDLGLVQQYRCEVHIIDPTPRAEQHFQKIKASLLAGRPLIEKQYSGLDLLGPGVLNKTHYHPLALWNESGSLKLFEPENPEHVSHSALNLQGTSRFIKVPSRRLNSLMKEFGHQQIDLLKLDIEGSEYAVIESILEDNLNIRLLCVEFDEVHQPLDWKYGARIDLCIKNLDGAGYELINVDTAQNCTFLKKD